eukprot:TRINITY_DN19198_c0_g1_i1.p1 TRINITY_DN19198_c0_g1~~TRINITY_DN19198_c0_g1_i1.p1  ORF type:complete len:295 (-),score=56.50 TRINITY_DN19198_c0_g1_i1:13-897(-)
MECLYYLVIVNWVATAQIIEPTNGGPWGTWGSWASCPDKNLETASGFITGAENSGGTKVDDTALNWVRIRCSDGDHQTDNEGPWGGSVNNVDCAPGYKWIGFKLLVEGSQGGGDDTAANYVMGLCGDVNLNQYETGSSGCCGWGTWGDWVVCPKYYAISSISLKVEAGLPGKGDDTAMNSMKATCKQAWDPCHGCFNGGSCNLQTAHCMCNSPWKGNHCEIEDVGPQNNNNNNNNNNGNNNDSSINYMGVIIGVSIGGFILLSALIGLGIWIYVRFYLYESPTTTVEVNNIDLK